jgi:hypothetical protein
VRRQVLQHPWRKPELGTVIADDRCLDGHK